MNLLSPPFKPLCRLSPFKSWFKTQQQTLYIISNSFHYQPNLTDIRNTKYLQRKSNRMGSYFSVAYNSVTADNINDEKTLNFPILGMGNPLLDISCHVDEEFLAKLNFVYWQTVLYIFFKK